MNKLRRQFAASYVVQASILLLVYFLAVPDSPYRPEFHSLTYAVSLWYRVSPTVAPFIFLLYGIQATLVLSALATLASRKIRRTDVIHYLFTSVLYLVLSVLLGLVLYIAVRPVTAHFKANGVTEIPFVMSYVCWLLVLLIGFAFMAYAKLRTRIRYFSMEIPSLRVGALFTGFAGNQTLKGFLLFLTVLCLAWIVPAFLILLGIVYQHILVLGAALMSVTLAASYGTFRIIAVFWDREHNRRKQKKEEAVPPPEQTK